MCGLPYEERSLTTITDVDYGAPVYEKKQNNNIQFLVGLAQKVLPISEWIKTPALYVKIPSFTQWIRTVTKIY